LEFFWNLWFEQWNLFEIWALSIGLYWWLYAFERFTKFFLQPIETSSQLYLKKSALMAGDVLKHISFRGDMIL
jgi:hypothetical protein